MAQSAVFHTDGELGLEVVTPAEGNWFGRSLAEPLDLSSYSMLKFDLETAENGTSGEIAIQVGPDTSWCQGGLWTWTNANSSKTIKRKLSELSCSEGVTKDLTQVPRDLGLPQRPHGLHRQPPRRVRSRVKRCSVTKYQ